MKKIISLALVVALITGLAACGTGSATVTPNYPKGIGFDDYEARLQRLNDNPVKEDFTAALDAFSFETASMLLSGQTDNVSYSPVSLYMALALAATGANGETQAEMLSVLGVSGSELATQTGNLYRRLYTDNAIGKLKIANSLWLQNDYSFKNSFTRNAAEDFYASLYLVDFRDGKTAKMMSDWISDNTNGLLSPEAEILSPEVESDDEQIMSIINTIYFKDEWMDAFDKSKTEKDTFYLADGGEVECDFMNMTYASHGYTAGEGFLSSYLSLKNGGSMVFILPDEGVSVDEMLADSDKIAAMFDTENREWSKVIFQIPKFSFGSELRLADTLKDLGINAAFESGADFSGITDDIAYISDVSQQTRVSIDEKGVEAAAFTSMMYSGAAAPKEEIAEMILDRPFIFGITASDGTLLFIGVVNNPIEG